MDAVITIISNRVLSCHNKQRKSTRPRVNQWPKNDFRLSLATMNAFIMATMSNSSVSSRWMFSTQTLFRRSADIVDRRYVFSRRSAENDRSAVAVLAGNTISSRSRAVTWSSTLCDAIVWSAVTRASMFLMSLASVMKSYNAYNHKLL